MERPKFVLDIVMDVAAAWYASGTFWAGAGAVAGVLGAMAVVWVTLTVGFPRRRLSYRMQAVAPLMVAPEGVRAELELRHRGKLLTDPRALTIELVSRGRKDIPNDAYNDCQPLRLDVGAPIVEILQITSDPATLATPKVAAAGTSVNIGPSLIGRRHTITITVLTDGGKPALTCWSPLIDVQVRLRSDEPSLAATRVAVAVAAAATAVVMGVTAAAVAGVGNGVWAVAVAAAVATAAVILVAVIQSNGKGKR